MKTVDVEIQRGNSFRGMIGSFIRSKRRRELGVGKMIGDGAAIEIEFFDSPVESERYSIIERSSAVERVTLPPQTRVYYFDQKTGNWRMGRIESHADDHCQIALPNRISVSIPEREAYIRWNKPIKDPSEHLAARVCETPFFHSGRADLLRSFVRQRAASCGMTAILSAPIVLERHQVEVVRRVLQDPVQRYLLADEVGLGKTIEAGVIIRQYVLDHLNDHQVLVIVPRTLVDQWKSELSIRCQLDERFGHNLTIVALEDISEMSLEELAAGMVVVDEAHQAVKGWEQPEGSPLRKRFETLRAITEPQVAPRLLLLSATPVRRNEDGFLALLHLLDPAVYSLNDRDSFREKVAKRQDLADLFYAFTEEQQSYFLEGMLDQLAEMFPRDKRLLSLLDHLRPWLDLSVPEDAGERRAAIRDVRSHLSETYRLHRRLLRNRRSADVEGLLPGRSGVTQSYYTDPAARLVEQGLEKWRAAAASEIWNREDSEEARALKRIFLILLQAAGSDLRAFAWLVAERMCPGQPQTERFGRLIEDEGVQVLQVHPHFQEEYTILSEMYKAAKGRNSNQCRIEHIGSIAKERVTLGFRVVVFASSPELADQLFEFLSRSNSVLVFRHQLEDTDWRSFCDVTTEGVLICDSAAEEGLNLQGGKTCMIHADIPLSPNSLEQRMGRLDRFGVGHPVISLAPVPEECPYQEAWLVCLTDAYSVFSRSIAALQYVVEDEMRELSDSLLFDGETALRESNRRLRGDEGKLQKELDAIRAQDELDSIDVVIDDNAIDLTSRIETFEEDAGIFQKSVRAWLGGRLHFICVGEREPTDNVVRYHYSQSGRGRPTLMSALDFHFWFARSVERGAKHPYFPPPLTWALSFSRETARSRKVGLGRIGNPVVDCLHEHLKWDDRGTCFAFWRVSDRLETSEVQLFLRFDFVIEAGLETVSRLAEERPELSEAALRRRADAAFPPIARTLWLSEDLEEPDEVTLADLELPYERHDKSVNINQDRWPLVEAKFDLANWPYHCRAARETAEEAVVRLADLTQLTGELSTRLELETAVVKEQCQSRIEALSAFPRESELAREELALEMSVRDALMSAIQRPGVRLDATGAIFLAGVALEEMTSG
ncbi:MAG: ATP-dependent helicase HepA [Verrucomicrobiales bacterium]